VGAEPESGSRKRSAAEDDCLVGALWDNLSDRRCRFVMVRGRQWEWIDA
jgi:hypothetical protein